MKRAWAAAWALLSIIKRASLAWEGHPRAHSRHYDTIMAVCLAGGRPGLPCLWYRAAQHTREEQGAMTAALYRVKNMADSSPLNAARIRSAGRGDSGGGQGAAGDGRGAAPLYHYPNCAAQLLAAAISRSINALGGASRSSGNIDRYLASPLPPILFPANGRRDRWWRSAIS